MIIIIIIRIHISSYVEKLKLQFLGSFSNSRTFDIKYKY